jgi:hypothetical protein
VDAAGAPAEAGSEARIADSLAPVGKIHALARFPRVTILVDRADALNRQAIRRGSSRDAALAFRQARTAARRQGLRCAACRSDCYVPVFSVDLRSWCRIPGPESRNSAVGSTG